MDLAEATRIIGGIVEYNLTEHVVFGNTNWNSFVQCMQPYFDHLKATRTVEYISMYHSLEHERDFGVTLRFTLWGDPHVHALSSSVSGDVIRLMRN